MEHLENLSIGVFIDGGYYAKINEGLQKQLSMRLDEKRRPHLARSAT